MLPNKSHQASWHEFSGVDKSQSHHYSESSRGSYITEGQFSRENVCCGALQLKQQCCSPRDSQTFLEFWDARYAPIAASSPKKSPAAREVTLPVR